MRLEGRSVCLRAVEPHDVDLLYRWENDTELWAVSGTTEPFSREQMARFVERQLEGADLLRSGQLRLIVEVRRAGEAAEQAGANAAQVTGKEAVRSMEGETAGSVEEEAVGAVDLFEYDPIHRRAGVGILIYGEKNRRRGYARETLEILCRYARERLHLHQLWCTVGADNAASLALFRAAGFAEAGTRRDWTWTPEGFRDEVLFQKFLEE